MTLAFARRMWALDAPTLTVDGATLMYGLNEKVTIPMPAFLIEHPKGLVLFDTGIAPLAIDDPVAAYGQELADALGMNSTPEQRIDRQLEAIGYKTSDVTHLVASHLHFDHSGGHHLFPNAKFYIGQGEFAFAYDPAPIGAFCFIRDELDAMRKYDWHEVPGVDVDLFGDGSLVILFMPGHTPGELSLKVRLASRTFILTGDALHLRDALELEYHFPIDADTLSAVRTIKRIKRLREAEDATVWISHDPQDWTEYQHAPYCYE
jgi:glyoxylase-like metal-dependent hydrolase (beta-lactamase superfamily II)